MKGLLDLFRQFTPDEHFDAIKIGLASPEKIRSWSFGEVKKPETINYRTFKPERDGLFCAKIFGPIKDYECLCGKYKRLKHRGVICEKCGVEVTQTKVRRERMGHIDLAAPCAHIWFLKSLPSRLGLVLDMTLRDIERVLYFEAYVVVDPGMTPLKKFSIMTEDDYDAKRTEYGDEFIALMGAEGVHKLLAEIDLDVEIDKLRNDMTGSELKVKKNSKRLKVMEAFKKSGIKPQWMVMEVLPVLPPDLRPLVPLDGGRFATSDLNDLYRRVINRNNRLARLLELKAPEIIVRNEKRMLQEAVDSLLDNGRRGKAMTGANKRALKSLADMIKGKSGRFRQNLLGKRVDYSGRSVIVVGPTLKLHQCGLPKLMALELFKPFIFSRLEAMGIATTIKAAKKEVESGTPVVWDILEEVIKEHPVLLNRAPTLHRLGIQAFEPVLIEGKAIQLHPLVCAAFNADFDGDQMAVHIPLSIEAQMEARTLMLASNNVLFPANGEPSIVPSQDVVLGLYYATRERINGKGEGIIFADVAEVQRALDNEQVEVTAKISVRLTEYEKRQGQRRVHAGDQARRHHRRPGAALGDPAEGPAVLEPEQGAEEEGDLAPDQHLVPQVRPEGHGRLRRQAAAGGFPPGDARRHLDLHRRHAGAEGKARPDRARREGSQGDRAAVRLGPRDLRRALQQGGRHLGQDRRRSRQGHDVPALEAEDHRPPRQAGRPGVVQLHLHDGRLGCARLRRADPPARRHARPDGQAGRLDHRDADHGELPRRPERPAVLHLHPRRPQGPGGHGAEDRELRLPDASPGRRDPGPGRDRGRLRDHERHEHARPGRRRRGDREPARPRARPRRRDRHPPSGDAGGAARRRRDARRGHRSTRFEAAAVDEVKVRTALTCGTRFGICAKCYGRDLGRGGLVNMGEAIGVIAAQSIGEPGTQLTMRTFHIGGAASRAAVASSVDAKSEGTVGFNPTMRYVTNGKGELVVISRSGEIVITDSHGRERERHKVPYGALLGVKSDQQIKAGTVLATWDPLTRPIITEFAGKAKFENVEEGVTVAKQLDEVTGLSTLVVIDPKRRGAAKVVRPQVKLLDAAGNEVKIPGTDHSVTIGFQVGSLIQIRDGQDLLPGEVLARIPVEGQKTRDITGGLPRVAELFEARTPKDKGTLAEMTGTVSFGKETKGKVRLQITDPEGKVYEELVPKEKNIVVHEGQVVNKGESIVDGPADPQDILRLLGMEELARYIVDEVQDVYRLQGVKINDKHIEVIVRQMLRRVQITNPGDTSYILNEQVERSELLDRNDKALAEGKMPATWADVLLGITKASLSTDSFISAASFQETTRVLTEAAIMGKRDELRGLKENVIVGRLIPAGTGMAFHDARKAKEAMDDAERRAIAVQEAEELASVQMAQVDAATAAAAASDVTE